MHRLILLTALMLGCTGADPSADPLAAEDPRDAARPLGVIGFDAEGRSPPLAIDLVDGDAAALWTRASADTCFALEALGHASRGAALDVLSPTPQTVRFQRLRCETGTALRAPLDDALTVAILPERAAPEGRLALRLVLTEHTALRGDPELQRALRAALADSLSALGLAVEVVAVVEVNGAPAEVQFADLKADALDALLGLAAPRPAATIDVVFAGCLRRVDALGTRSAVEGFTGRVGGGGGGAADAVFMPGRRCDAFTDAPAALDPARVAHVLTHELGHYLGLPHSDDPNNLMFLRPSLASARGLTDAQRRQLHRHPLVR